MLSQCKIHESSVPYSSLNIHNFKGGLFDLDKKTFLLSPSFSLGFVTYCPLKTQNPVLSLSKGGRGTQLWLRVIALFQQQLPAGKAIDGSFIKGYKLMTVCVLCMQVCQCTNLPSNESYRIGFPIENSNHDGSGERRASQPLHHRHRIYCSIRASLWFD